MATHTQIIDLFGIPACGKTTLASYMNKKQFNGLLYASAKEAHHEMKQTSILKIAKCINCRSIISAIRFISYFPYTKNRRDLPILKWLRDSIFRSFYRKYSRYDVILIDHGAIQTFVSWERGEDYHNDSEFQQRALDYLNSIESTIFVFCDVSNFTSIERIRKRGRDHGRLDMILETKEDSIQSELDAERLRFQKIAELIKKNGHNMIILNTNGVIEDIANELAEKISKL